MINITMNLWEDGSYKSAGGNEFQPTLTTYILDNSPESGGHLAASLGVFWNKSYIKKAIGMPKGMNRPNALILGYPVITSGEYGHKWR